MVWQNSDEFYLWRLGDSTLILSQRLSEWCGKGPALEEDMALTNVALDLIGQARLWLALGGEKVGQDEDQLAFLRDAHQFNNIILVEQPNGNYACTIARQFFFDIWHYLLLSKLINSPDPKIAAIAEKSLKEVAYHLRRSSDLIIHIGDGTRLSHDMLQTAINDLWAFTGEMFSADIINKDIRRQISDINKDIYQSWLAKVENTLNKATITMPDPKAWMQKSHTEHLGYLLAEMQFLPRSYPGQKW